MGPRKTPEAGALPRYDEQKMTSFPYKYGLPALIDLQRSWQKGDYVVDRNKQTVELRADNIDSSIVYLCHGTVAHRLQKS
jgi:hypothetical protein